MKALSLLLTLGLALWSGCVSSESARAPKPFAVRLAGYGLLGEAGPDGVPAVVVQTNRIDPAQGVRFGIVFTVEGAVPGQTVRLSRIVRPPTPRLTTYGYRPEGIAAPVQLPPSLGDTNVGAIAVDFGRQFRVVAGTWTVELWSNGQMLLSRDFFVTEPPQLAAAHMGGVRWGTADTSGMQLGALVLTNRGSIACLLRNDSDYPVRIHPAALSYGCGTAKLFARSVGMTNWQLLPSLNSRADQEPEPKEYTPWGARELLPHRVATLPAVPVEHTFHLKVKSFVVPAEWTLPVEAYIELTVSPRATNAWSGTVATAPFPWPTAPR